MKASGKSAARTVTCVLACVLSFTQGPGAIGIAAAQPATGTQGEPNEVRDLIVQANRAMDENQLESARALFLKAWGLKRSYDVAAGLGQAELELGRFRDAAEHLEYCLREFPPTENRELEKEIRAGFERAKEHVGVLALTVDRARADVLVDGVRVGSAPLPSVLFLEPGPHAIEARLDGASAAERVDVAVGKEHGLTLRLQDEAPAPTASPSSSPGISRPWIPITLGAIALAGAGTWAGFLIASNNAEDDVERYRDQLGGNGCTQGAVNAETCANAQDAYDRQRRNATISRVGLSVAVLAGAATAGYLLFAPPKREAKPTGRTLRPLVALDRQGGAFVLSGDF
jgi:tetratricopeptide (TPR) repeat protein